jgi:hypothetical protein
MYSSLVYKRIMQLQRKKKHKNMATTKKTCCSARTHMHTPHRSSNSNKLDQSQMEEL